MAIGAIVGWRRRDPSVVVTIIIGQGCEPPNVWRFVTGLSRAAGLLDRRLHDLRHISASLLITQGVPAGTGMEVLWHFKIATRMDTCAHGFAAGHQDVADSMDWALAG